MNRVLIVFPNWIGDCLMATPALRALKENKKSSFIGIIVHERVSDIFKNSPFVDRIIESNFPKNIFGKLSLISKISREKFDTVFLLKPSFTKSFVCKVSGIKDIVGFKSKKFTFINKPIEPAEADVHKMDYYLRLLEKSGLKVEKKKSEFFLSDQERKQAQAFLKDLPLKKFRIAVHPRANWDLKMWPAERFASLCDRLIEDLECCLIITGTKQDLDLCSRIGGLMVNKPYILAGKTNLRELAALLKEVDLFISPDTGIMHLAASINTPLIALFGATSPFLNGPRADGAMKIIYNDTGCEKPCYKLGCRDNICMKNIFVEEVFKAAKEMLLVSRQQRH
ncbi:MAG: lipopolysaccharide heptosyltransferase II [Candidatus Omnitrophica bacterium]|nr:lipopolysaccharide heptosyltransferase II [Candidatus Omnitrophota bacterium]